MNENENQTQLDPTTLTAATAGHTLTEAERLDIQHASLYRGIDGVIEQVERIFAARGGNTDNTLDVLWPVVEYVNGVEAFYGEDEDPWAADDVIDSPSGDPADDAALRWRHLTAIRDAYEGPVLGAAPAPSKACGERVAGGRCVMPAGHQGGHGQVGLRCAPAPTDTEQYLPEGQAVLNYVRGFTGNRVPLPSPGLLAACIRNSLAAREGADAAPAPTCDLCGEER